MSAREGAPLRVVRGDGANGDPDLMRRLSSGELEALGTLYDRYQGDMRRFAARAGGAEDADDLVHEAFLMLPRIASTYDGRPCARPFLIGITAQLVRRRRRGLGRVAEVLREIAAAAPSSRRTPEQAASDTEELALFEKALRRLADDKRIVFVMIESEGLSGAEVAQALGIPVATVWTRLHYARRELRAAIEKRRVP